MLSAAAVLVEAAEQSTNALVQGNWEARTWVCQSPRWVLCLAEQAWWLGDASCLSPVPRVTRVTPLAAVRPELARQRSAERVPPGFVRKASSSFKGCCWGWAETLSVTACLTGLLTDNEPKSLQLSLPVQFWLSRVPTCRTVKHFFWLIKAAMTKFTSGMSTLGEKHHFHGVALKNAIWGTELHHYFLSKCWKLFIFSLP